MVLPNATLFPRTMLPLYIFEKRYRQMLMRSLQGDRLFAVAMKRQHLSRDLPCRVAGLGMVRVAVRNDDGSYHLVLQGLSRIKLGKAVSYRPFRRHKFTLLSAEKSGSDSESDNVRALMQNIVKLVGMRLEQGSEMPMEILKELAASASSTEDVVEDQLINGTLGAMASLGDPEQLVDLVSCTLLTIPHERQMMLEELDIESRLNSLVSFLSAEVARNA